MLRAIAQRRCLPASLQSSPCAAGVELEDRTEAPSPALPTVEGGSSGVRRPLLSLDGSPRAEPGCQPCFMRRRWPILLAGSGADGAETGVGGGGVAGAAMDGDEYRERSIFGVVAGEWSGYRARLRALLSTYCGAEDPGIDPGVDVLAESRLRFNIASAARGCRGGAISGAATASSLRFLDSAAVPAPLGDENRGTSSLAWGEQSAQGIRSS